MAADKASVIYRNSLYVWFMIKIGEVQLDYSFYCNPDIEKVSILERVNERVRDNQVIREELLFKLLNILNGSNDHADATNVVKLGIFLMKTSHDYRLKTLKNMSTDTVKLWCRKVDICTEGRNPAISSKSLDELDGNHDAFKLDEVLSEDDIGKSKSGSALFRMPTRRLLNREVRSKSTLSMDLTNVNSTLNNSSSKKKSGWSTSRE